jgi:hypothetical protein
MKIVVGISVFLLFTAFLHAQQTAYDFGCWGWIKVNKQISKHQTIGIQYQMRLKDQLRQFDRSNFYVNYSYDLKRKFTAEVLYQWNTNHSMDQHTFYIGCSKKIELGKPSLILRTAFQYIRDTYTIPELHYTPYLEWRNRIRLRFPISKRISTSISGEPYLHFSGFGVRPQWTRARFIGQMDWSYNKYMTFSVFFLSQPTLVSYSQPSIKNVLGFTYQADLPKKHTEMGKLISYKKNKKQTDHP